MLSCGVAFPDVLTVLGKHVMKTETPFVPCSEICGEVTAIGSGVSGLAVGDCVFGALAILGGKVIFMPPPVYLNDESITE